MCKATWIFDECDNRASIFVYFMGWSRFMFTALTFNVKLDCHEIPKMMENKNSYQRNVNRERKF